MRRKYYLTGAVIVAALSLQSCFDKSYDLDDIDLTIGTNADLTLPKSSTGDIILKNIMDLKEDGVVQFVDDGAGNSYFAVIQDGTTDIKPIKIDRVSFNPQLSSIDPISINLREMGTAAARRKVQVTVPVPGVGDQTVDIDPDQTFHYDMEEGKAKYTIDSNNSSSRSSISTDVVEIDSVGFKDNTTLNVVMHISGMPNWLPVVKMNNLTLQIPEGLIVKESLLNGQQAVQIDNEAGVIYQTGNNEVLIPTNGAITLQLKLAGLRKSETAGKGLNFDRNLHEVSFGGDFVVGGTFTMSTADIDNTLLYTYLQTVPAEDLSTIVSTHSLQCVMPESITFNGDANFTNQGIVLEQFKGVLQHEVTALEPIKLDDLPDFLNDDEVILDLQNPVILLKARQELPTAATTSLTLKSEVRGTKNSLTTYGITIPSGTEYTYYYIAESELTDLQKKLMPAEYRNATRLSNTVGKVSDLIRLIPKQIDVEVSPIQMEAHDVAIDITRTYNVDVEYKVFAPLTVGKDFQLVYRDSERDFAEDLDDYDDLNADRIELYATAISNVPADITLSLIPIDKNANRIPQLDVNSVTIARSTDGGEKSTSVLFTIKGANINGKQYTINDVLAGKNGAEQLDGITYEARINNATAGTTLRENAKILLKDIQITIKGGITYDAN